MCVMDSGTTSSVLEGALASRNDTRKSNKPLMEKKRRQRINRCLNELKLLVLEALRKDPSRYNKLEKADILEMTVRYVQALHQEGGRSVGGGRLMGGVRPIGGDEKAKYRAGFVQCAVEVRRYLAGISGVPEDLHSKVISHLNSVSSGVTGGQGVPGCPSLMVGGGVVTVAPPIPAHMPTTAPLVVTTTTDSTTGGHRQDGSFAMSFKNPQTSMFPESPKSVTIGGGITLVPARLASGQVALVVPPGTALPIEASNTRSSTPLTDSNNLVNNESLRNITPFIPFRSSRKADAGTGASVLSSTNVFPKDTFVASSHSLSASGLPASHYTSQIITLSHPKILPRSLDVATVTSSSQVLSTRKITVVPGKSSVHLPDAMTVALPDSLVVSKENWGTHITSVPTHTTSVPTQATSVPTHTTSVPTHTTYAPVHTTNTTTHTSNPIAHTTNTTTHTTSSKACTTSTTTHTPNTTSYITSPTTHTTSTTTHTPNTTSYITSPTTHTTSTTSHTTSTTAHTTSTTTQTPKPTLQKNISTTSASTTDSLSSHAEKSNSLPLQTSTLIPAEITPASSAWVPPTNLQIPLNITNTSKEPTSTVSNYSLPSWPIFSTFTPCRPTPTILRVPQLTSIPSAKTDKSRPHSLFFVDPPAPPTPSTALEPLINPSTNKNQQLQPHTTLFLHTLEPSATPTPSTALEPLINPSTNKNQQLQPHTTLFLSTLEPPPPSTPTPTPQEPLNLVTSASREGVWERRSLKSATHNRGRVTPYEVPSPGQHSQHWRPW